MMKKIINRFVAWVGRRFNKKKSEEPTDNPHNYPLF